MQLFDFVLLFELAIAFVSSPLPSRWAVRPYWSVQLYHWFMTLPESTHKVPLLPGNQYNE